MAAELRFDEILRTLTRHGVSFIVVGGIAAALQGSPLTTEHVDIVYFDSEENIDRLASALKELNACYVDPAGRTIEPDVARLARMKVHLLKTSCGRIDVLRTIGQDLTYQDLRNRSHEIDIADFHVRALDLEAIIETKAYADRPKGRHQLLYLRQLLAETRRLDTE